VAAAKRGAKSKVSQPALLLEGASLTAAQQVQQDINRTISRTLGQRPALIPCSGIMTSQAIALFNALPCSDSCGEMSERTFEGVVRMACRRLYRTKNHWFCVPG
jgi:hypothetical protein